MKNSLAEKSGKIRDEKSVTQIINFAIARTFCLSLPIHFNNEAFYSPPKRSYRPTEFVCLLNFCGNCSKMGNLSALKTPRLNRFCLHQQASRPIYEPNWSNRHGNQETFWKYEEPTNNKIGCLEDKVNPKTQEIRKCMGP